MTNRILCGRAYVETCGAPEIGLPGSSERAAWLRWRDEHALTHNPRTCGLDAHVEACKECR